MQWKFNDITKKDEPIDYMIYDKRSSKCLLVALTGTNGSIGANHKKIAQLFGAIPLVKDDQRLVFLVNTLAEEDPDLRSIDKCITQEAIKRMTEHKISIMQIYDLYRLWKDHSDKKLSSDEIFDLIHSNSGLFKYNIP